MAIKSVTSGQSTPQLDSLGAPEQSPNVAAPASPAQATDHFAGVKSGPASAAGEVTRAAGRFALVAAAEMILAVRALPERMKGNMVATVGEIQNYPNSRNIIPDKVHFTVDIRSWDNNHALKAWELLKKDFQDIAARHGTPIKIDETWRVVPAPSTG